MRKAEAANTEQHPHSLFYRQCIAALLKRDDFIGDGFELTVPTASYGSITIDDCMAGALERSKATADYTTREWHSQLLHGHIAALTIKDQRQPQATYMVAHPQDLNPHSYAGAVLERLGYDQQGQPIDATAWPADIPFVYQVTPDVAVLDLSSGINADTARLFTVQAGIRSFLADELAL